MLVVLVVVVVAVALLEVVGRALDVLACEGLLRRAGVCAPFPALLVDADELHRLIPLEDALLVCVGGKVQTP